jgi:hypothetical protein
MKKVRVNVRDELRPEYQRSDFGEMVRGKYVQRKKPMDPDGINDDLKSKNYFDSHNNRSA